MSDILYSEQDGVAVLLGERGCNQFWACGTEDGPALFWEYADALKFRDELHARHSLGKGRVVKVRLKVEVVE